MTQKVINLQEWEHIPINDNDKRLVGVTLPEDAVTQELIQSLSKSERLEITELRRGITIKAHSYVGRIVIGDVQITIRPKIAMLPLLQLMQYTYGLRDLKLFAPGNFTTESISFQDLLIAQFIAEVRELVTRGLHRRYVRKEHVLASPRGSIDVQKIARQGGVLQALLPCTHYPRLDDCLINQVLLQGIQLALHLTNDSRLCSSLYQLKTYLLSDISSIKLNKSVLIRLRQEMSRLTSAYQPAITLIEIMFESKGISLNDGEEAQKLDGFLFNMNAFFQSLLERFLREYLQQEEIVSSQEEIYDKMVYLPDNNCSKRKNPKFRPDYVVRRQGEVVAILDAKYIDLRTKPLGNILYQLAMYALSYSSCATATILYPVVDDITSEAIIEVRIPSHGRECAYVVIRPVNVVKLATVLSTKNNGQERSDFARMLAFGNT